MGGEWGSDSTVWCGRWAAILLIGTLLLGHQLLCWQRVSHGSSKSKWRLLLQWLLLWTTSLCFFLTARKIFFWGVSLAWLSGHTSNTQRQTHLSRVGHHYRCGDWSTERANVLLQESEGWPLTQVHTALEDYQGIWLSFNAREKVKPIALRTQELSSDVFPIWTMKIHSLICLYYVCIGVA